MNTFFILQNSSKNYRIITKDRTLGGDGEFIGYKSHLNVTMVKRTQIHIFIA